MAADKTILAIRKDIEGHGASTVPFVTVEYVLGTACTDDATFESSISAAVLGIPWLTGFEVDWIHRNVVLYGPAVEVDN